MPDACEMARALCVLPIEWLLTTVRHAACLCLPYTISHRKEKKKNAKRAALNILVPGNQFFSVLEVPFNFYCLKLKYYLII